MKSVTNSGGTQSKTGFNTVTLFKAAPAEYGSTSAGEARRLKASWLDDPTQRGVNLYIWERTITLKQKMYIQYTL